MWLRLQRDFSGKIRVSCAHSAVKDRPATPLRGGLPILGLGEENRHDVTDGTYRLRTRPLLTTPCLQARVGALLSRRYGQSSGTVPGTITGMGDSASWVVISTCHLYRATGHYSTNPPPW